MQTLIHAKPVKPMQATRKSDFGLVYRGEKINQTNNESQDLFTYTLCLVLYNLYSIQCVSK